MKSLIFLILLLKLAQSQETTESTTESPYIRHCHTCEGNINTHPCSFFQPLNETSAQGTEETRCENNMESCYTSVNNEVVRRGCIGDGYCDTHDCETCNVGFCNSDNKASLTCFYCHSHEYFSNFDENCEDNPEKVRELSCNHTEYRYEKHGCYSAGLNETRDGATIHYVMRGCIGFLINRYEQCDNDEDDSCIVCMKDHCNIHDVRSGGKINLPTTTLIFPLLLLTYKMYQ